MSVRTYVGARYVPRFLGTYDPTQNYEGLDVVDNGSGTSYISRKITPAGTPLTDTDHWAIYGAASGAIISLQNQIDDIHGIIATPEMFGAVGDGITDDTADIQSALNAADTILMLGDYKITDTLTVPAGVNIIGPGSIIIDDSNTQFDGLDLQGNNTIKNMVFTNTYATLRLGDAVIAATNKTHLKVEGCTFENITLGYCVLFDQCEHIEIEHNIMKHYSYAGIMLMNGCMFITVQFNYIYDGQWTGNSNRYGISVSGYDSVATRAARYIKCNFNHVEDVTPLWEGIDSHSCQDAEFIGNTIINTGIGIQFSAPTTPTLQSGKTMNNVRIAHNFIKTGVKPDNQASGILCTIHSTRGIGPIENVDIKNNYIELTGNTYYHSSIVAGISLRSNNKDCIIESNTIKNSAPGISIGAEATNIHIMGNEISEGNTSSDYSIMCADISTVKNVLVKDNFIHDCVKSFRGPTTAVAELVTYKNNKDNGDYDTVTYTTAPRNTINTNTTALGNSGDFIPCSDAGGSVVGWACIEQGTWKAISGT